MTDQQLADRVAESARYWAKAELASAVRRRLAVMAAQAECRADFSQDAVERAVERAVAHALLTVDAIVAEERDR